MNELEVSSSFCLSSYKGTVIPYLVPDRSIFDIQLRKDPRHRSEFPKQLAIDLD